MNLSFSLYPDVYPLDIHVYIGNDKEKGKRYFKKFLPKGVEIEPPSVSGGYAATTFAVDNQIFFDFNLDKNRSAQEFAGLVAHEAVHGSWKAECALGDLFNMEIQEPQCYFVQYLVVNILGRYWDWRRKNDRK